MNALCGATLAYGSCVRPLDHAGHCSPRPAVQPDTPDDATNPAHYRDLTPEPIDVIEGWNLDFHRASALKYIARAGRKGDAAEDLRKARWYLDRAIARLETARG